MVLDCEFFRDRDCYFYFYTFINKYKVIRIILWGCVGFILYGFMGYYL